LVTFSCPVGVPFVVCYLLLDHVVVVVVIYLVICGSSFYWFFWFFVSGSTYRCRLVLSAYCYAPPFLVLGLQPILHDLHLDFAHFI